jgi:hypothetical protein
MTATRQPPTTTDQKPQRRRDHGGTPNFCLMNSLDLILCALGASVVRKATLRQTMPIARAGPAIGDWRLRIADCGFAGRQRGAPVDKMRNKPKSPMLKRSCRAVPWFRDTRYASPDTRRRCRRRAKQTQSRYMLWFRFCGALHVEG